MMFKVNGECRGANDEKGHVVKMGAANCILMLAEFKSLYN